MTDTTIDHTAALTADYAARVGTWSDIQGHLPTLRDTAASYPAVRVLELGVRSGNSTAAFLLAAAAVGGHVWSVDITLPQVPGWWVDTGLWTLHVGDDLNPATWASLPAEVDVLFVDTSHAYDHTLGELRAHVPRVRPGGVVLCHDTELQEPEQVGPQPPFPVAKALDAYCAETGLAWVNRPGSYGLGVLEVPDKPGDRTRAG